MKNIFYIHSHITYFVAKGVIKYLELSSESLIFVLSRSFENDKLSKANCIDFTEIHDNLDSFNLLNFRTKLPDIKKVDNILYEELKGEDFKAYLPHVFHPLMQIIATNSQCKELHILEEGVNAYSNYFMHFNEKNKLKGIIKRVINKLSFIGQNRIFFIKNFDLRKFEKTVPPVFYTITSKGFRGLPYKTVKVNMVSENKPKYRIVSKKVLVLEGAVEQGNLKLNTFLKAIDLVLKDIKGNQIAIKFHPAQKTKNKKKIIEIINKHNKKEEVIPNNIAFEQIILNNTNLEVYGFATSLLFYAKEYGCKVKSYENLLHQDPLFKEFRSKNDFNLKALLDG